ncbi:unnamed protein product [Haemonchus placei]|uniref:Uncharacterized protein n=1 Tax=Haemonchus placei TaxID=6290 RepID=A0A3P7YKD5_HAEPC|nr:unnamed protein product [Haemonchus placei]
MDQLFLPAKSIRTILIKLIIELQNGRKLFLISCLNEMMKMEWIMRLRWSMTRYFLLSRP